ncbi:hypothetical protein [Streptomyces niveus]|uniref:hypothetical protein n=1 Tax=Streptomyces niveus TaxID=193462 RepID=UPI0036E831CB
MHTDVPLQPHALRAAELRTEAAEFRLSRAGAPGPGRLVACWAGSWSTWVRASYTAPTYTPPVSPDGRGTPG